MKRLYLSNIDRKVAGVCGGLAEYFDIDPTLVRLAVVVTALATAIFPVFVGYILAWMIVPRKAVNQV